MSQRVIAGVLLVVISPLLLVLCLLIMLADGRPVLFRQQRLGRGRRPFEILKLKTMVAGEVTRLGRLLRRCGLDELPQLVNIACGDMRFIGPRPLTDGDVLRLGWDGAAYDSRWLVPPGLTGLAQLAPTCHRRVSWFLDDHYARHRSALLDAKVVGASLLVVVVGKDRAKALVWR